jgi:hypothetical protein
MTKGNTRNTGRKGQHSTVGKINSPCNDDNGHTDAQDVKDGSLSENIDDIACF